MARSLHARWLTVLLLAVLVLGVTFRLTNLDGKIYWHDEVYTSMRAAGYTRDEIDQALFQDQFVPAVKLQLYQQIKPGSSSQDTLTSLTTEDPQHPPLYFLMARGWLRLFGSSLTASRLLPALISLISLALMYGLAQALFQSALAAWIATALLAVSPFDILFAQTARQYSLLTLTVIAASWALIRTLSRPSLMGWGLYAAAVTVGLYTHPFFGLSLIGFSVYVALLSGVDLWRAGLGKPTLTGAIRQAEASPGPATPPIQHWRKALLPSCQFALANVLALILYWPWLRVIIGNSARMFATTDWTRYEGPLTYLVKLWVLSFTSLFIDLDFGFTNPLTFALRVPFLVLIGFSLYWVYRKTPLATWLFISTSVAVPFLVLVLPDLLEGGKRSAVTRYLISCFPAVQLAVAYGLASLLTSGKQLGRWLLVGVLTSAIASCLVSAHARTWWSKDLSFTNAQIAEILNTAAATGSPVLVSGIGDDYTNTGDLISLSYELKDSVRLYLTRQPPDLTPVQQETLVFLFRPSQEMVDAFTRQGKMLQPFEGVGRFWRVQ